MDRNNISPDLKQMYEKVMSTPVKPNSQAQVDNKTANLSAKTQQINTQNPAAQSLNTSAFTQAAPQRQHPETFIMKDIPLTETQNTKVNVSKPQGKNSAVMIIGLSIIFFLAYAFFWLVFFGIISRSSLGI